MHSHNKTGVPRLAACTLAAALGLASLPASAGFDFDETYAAGEACVFSLRLEGYDSKLQYREFYDRSGELVRILLAAGKGSRIVMTNLENGASFTMKSAGASGTLHVNADGTSTLVATGHFITTFFPTDDPPGPWTTMFSGGRQVYSIDANGVSTLQSESGKMTDICELLSE